ncbi:Uncharacterised protein [Mycobacteroides abscessus subsp. abscessus]|nr:Uncharacterised protein [Mycobacteroides abscessus subsp. abscessus]
MLLRRLDIAEDRPDGRRPHDDRHRSTLELLRRGVGGRVPALQARGSRGPEEAHTDEEEQGDAREDGHDDEERSGEGESVADGERPAAIAHLRETRERQSEQSCAEDRGRLREPGEFGATGELFGEDAADGEPGGHADAGEELRQTQRPLIAHERARHVPLLISSVRIDASRDPQTPRRPGTVARSAPGRLQCSTGGVRPDGQGRRARPELSASRPFRASSGRRLHRR